MSTTTTTPDRFTALPDELALASAVTALEEHGFSVEVVGNLDAASAADAALGLTDLWMVPSETPPHRAQPIASSYHRFAMVALAVNGHPTWRASDIELSAALPSYTAATLDRLHALGYTTRELFFVVGADAFAEIGNWKDFPSILDRAHFAVVSRTGFSANEMPRRLPALALVLDIAGQGLAHRHPLNLPTAVRRADNGAGLGASHQTGWTGIVAKLIELFGHLDGPQLLEAGRAGAFAPTA